MNRSSRKERRRRKNVLRVSIFLLPFFFVEFLLANTYLQKITFDEDGDVVMMDADAKDKASARQADPGHLGTTFGSRHKSSLPEKADEDVEMADADSYNIQDVDIEMTDV